MDCGLDALHHCRIKMDLAPAKRRLLIAQPTDLQVAVQVLDQGLRVNADAFSTSTRKVPKPRFGRNDSESAACFVTDARDFWNRPDTTSKSCGDLSQALKNRNCPLHHNRSRQGHAIRGRLHGLWQGLLDIVIDRNLSRQQICEPSFANTRHEIGRRHQTRLERCHANLAHTRDLDFAVAVMNLPTKPIHRIAKPRGLDPKIAGITWSRRLLIRIDRHLNARPQILHAHQQVIQGPTRRRSVPKSTFGSWTKLGTVLGSTLPLCRQY
jgi:hypothetical protein